MIHLILNVSPGSVRVEATGILDRQSERKKILQSNKQESDFIIQEMEHGNMVTQATQWSGNCKDEVFQKCNVL